MRKPDAPERDASRLRQFTLGAGGSPEPERMSGMGLDGQRDILQRGEMRKQRRDLKRARQAEEAPVMHRQRGDVAPVEMDATSPRCRCMTGASSAWRARFRSRDRKSTRLNSSHL